MAKEYGIKFVRRIGGADLNTNPYFNDKKFVGSGGYYKGNTSYQCANWIGRVCEIAEERATYFGTDIKPPKPMFNRKGYGNAKDWFIDTLWDKTTKSNEVRLGDVVCYGKGYGAGYGHIRIVEAITDDYFICSGANEDGHGKVKFDIKISKQNGGGETATGLMGYIHNPFITNDTKDIDYKKLYEEAQKKLDKIKEIL